MFGHHHVDPWTPDQIRHCRRPNLRFIWRTRAVSLFLWFVWLDRPNVVFGDNDVVEPDVTDVIMRCFGDVKQHPQEIDLQLLVASPAKTFKGQAAVRKLQAFGGLFLVAPANAFAALTGQELFVNPLPFRKTLAEMAG